MSEAVPPAPWHAFFLDLNDALENVARLDCIGGFVVTQLYRFVRPTADVDVIELAPREASVTLMELAMQGYRGQTGRDVPRSLPQSPPDGVRPLRHCALEAGTKQPKGPRRCSLSRIDSTFRPAGPSSCPFASAQPSLPAHTTAMLALLYGTTRGVWFATSFPPCSRSR